MNEISVMPWALKKRKLYCCTCGEKLVPYPRTRIIKPGDPEHKKHSRLGSRMHLVGDIELTEYDCKCLSCDKLISYDEQCVIGEIQKQLDTHILSSDDVNENLENEKATLTRKRKIRGVVGKALGVVVTILVIFLMLKSGKFSFYF